MITEIHDSPTRGPRYQAIVHLFPQLQAYHSGIDMHCHEIAPQSQTQSGSEGVGKATEHIPDSVVSRIQMGGCPAEYSDQGVMHTCNANCSESR